MSIHAPQKSTTQLVMMILLRPAEDVITVQTSPFQRCGDINQALTQNMEGIIVILLMIPQLHVVQYRHLVSIWVNGKPSRPFSLDQFQKHRLPHL